MYLNPDEIEKAWSATGWIDLAHWGISTESGDILAFLENHPQVLRRGGDRQQPFLHLKGSALGCDAGVDSYLAAALVDFLRHRLLDQGRDFCFESVMSSKDKVQFLESASNRGARTYLYYVATEDPEINVARVTDRVRKGGHDVPVWFDRHVLSRL